MGTYTVLLSLISLSSLLLSTSHAQIDLTLANRRPALPGLPGWTRTCLTRLYAFTLLTKACVGRIRTRTESFSSSHRCGGWHFHQHCRHSERMGRDTRRRARRYRGAAESRQRALFWRAGFLYSPSTSCRFVRFFAVSYNFANVSAGVINLVRSAPHAAVLPCETFFSM